jgi:hypothetical protein
MHFATDTEEAAKAHGEWASFLGIDMRVGAVADQQRFIDVKFLNGLLTMWRAVKNRNT